ncbi:MAG: SDR family NAD(P)-dependent oxidoreductase, partial [Pseudomonadota bacterium]
MRLSGKSAIVTGGASGFGEGIARKFVAEGAKVLIADLNLEGAERLAGELGAMAVRTDVAEDQSVQTMVETATREFGQVDILVNNAAINPYYGPLEGSEESVFDKIMDVNVKAPWVLSNLLLPT